MMEDKMSGSGEYTPSPAEIRKAEEYLDDTSFANNPEMPGGKSRFREATEDLEDALFEASSMGDGGQNPKATPKSSPDDNQPVEENQESPEEARARLEYEQAERLLKKAVAEATSFDEIIAAVKAFNVPNPKAIYDKDTGFTYNMIANTIYTIKGYEYLPDAERDGNIHSKLMWLPMSCGVRAAVARLMGVKLEKNKPVTPKPDTQSLPSFSLEEERPYKYIPLKRGVVVSGYIESVSPDSIVLITKQGKMVINTSDILDTDGIFEKKNTAEPINGSGAEQSDSRQERHEIFRDIDKEPVYVVHGEGCVGNINHSFGDFAEQHKDLLEGIRGKKVLIKVNAVDPSHPDACTSAESLKATIDNLLKYGPAEICIGDQPAGQFIEKSGGGEIDSEELFRRFREQLGYDFLDQYSDVRFIDFRTELRVPEPTSPEDARMYNLSKFQSIFVLSLPKAHGQLDFTGCRKNIVGLLPTDERYALLHPRAHDVTQEDWRKSNSPGMQRISEAFAAQNPNTIYVMDGFKTIIGNEHTGVPRESDYAIVSMDSFNADILASTLSFSPDLTQRVEYLHKIPVQEKPGKTIGSMPESPNKSFDQHRMVYSGSRDDGAVFQHETIIDLEFDEVVVRPIEESLENITNVSEINNLDEVIETLRETGSDRAISCLLRIAELAHDRQALKTIFYSVNIPITSSRDASSSPSFVYSSQNGEMKSGDELYDRYQKFYDRVVAEGVVS